MIVNEYGWRGKIGILIPAGNTTMEPEFYRMAPDGVSIHCARMIMEKANTPEEKVKALVRMSENVEHAATEIAYARVGVIAYGCTSGSFVAGANHDKEIIQRIENATGIQTVTTSTAVVQAIKELQITRISIATPYAEKINEMEREFLETNIPSLKVSKMKGLGIVSGGGEISNLPFHSAYEVAKEVDTPESDGCFISCTAWKSIEIIDKLEKDLGKPVVTSNQASMWAALKILKIGESVEGYGHLLSKPR